MAYVSEQGPEADPVVFLLSRLVESIHDVLSSFTSQATMMSGDFTKETLDALDYTLHVIEELSSKREQEVCCIGSVALNQFVELISDLCAQVA